MNGIDRRHERLLEQESTPLTTGSLILLPTGPPSQLSGVHAGTGALLALYGAAHTGGLFPETNELESHRTSADSWPRGGHADITVGTRPVRGDAPAKSASTSRRSSQIEEKASGTTIRFEDVLNRRLALQASGTSNATHHQRTHVRSKTETSS